MVPLAGLEPACLAAFDFESNTKNTKLLKFFANYGIFCAYVLAHVLILSLPAALFFAKSSRSGAIVSI